MSEKQLLHAIGLFENIFDEDSLRLLSFPLKVYRSHSMHVDIKTRLIGFGMFVEAVACPTQEFAKKRFILKRQADRDAILASSADRSSDQYRPRPRNPREQSWPEKAAAALVPGL
ncbi:hypothetical protein FVA81_01495 (plasmid) [Rhizobium sp. WL3]|uniref:hypothetical protein n=1 Tax=Rhizobium sp. WL3 TaxID=2603277 RepID=UPI0011C1E93C|nr:hypothetical protein [Rhizobium sp. WL3]QEE43349.1 hypothetical protein FVA81_01495 [Rhizobium sp. WL3]